MKAHCAVILVVATATTFDAALDCSLRPLARGVLESTCDVSHDGITLKGLATSIASAHAHGTQGPRGSQGLSGTNGADGATGAQVILLGLQLTTQQ